MIRHVVLFWVFTSVVGRIAAFVGTCPQLCRCTEWTDGSTKLQVDCSVVLSDDGKKQSQILQDLPQGIPKDVTQLLFANQALTEITIQTFSQFRKLESISLESNSIKSISSRAFSQLSQLRTLSLTDNIITKIDDDAFVGLTKLESLQLAKNGLTSLSFLAQLTSSRLQAVDLGRNKLLDCTVPDSFTVATRLIFSNNLCSRLTAETFRPVRATLVHLILANNSIAALSNDTFSELTVLGELDLSDNPSISWKDDLAPLKLPDSLSKLNIEGVKRDSPSDLASSLAFLPSNISELHLSKCGLSGVIPSFSQFRSLSILYVDENTFTSFPQPTPSHVSQFPPSLEHFNAGSNKFVNLSSYVFAGLNKLQYVSLRDNRITSLDRMAFGEFAPSMHELDLSNALALPPGVLLPAGLIGSMVNLQTLVLSGNALSQNTLLDLRDDFDQLTKLSRLDLDGNDFRGFADKMFAKMVKLQYLNIQENLLGEAIAADVEGRMLYGLESLTIIQLDMNNVTEVPDNFFANVGPDLREVDFTLNKLTTVPTGALLKQKNLARIILTSNDIKLLSPRSFEGMSNRTTVDMWSNPFDCSCSNYEFLRWLEKRDVRAGPTIYNLKCRSPENMVDRAPIVTSRMALECITPTSSRALLAFFVALLCIFIVLFGCWLAVKKIRNYFPYKPLINPTTLLSTNGGHRVEVIVGGGGRSSVYNRPALDHPTLAFSSIAQDETDEAM